MTNEALGNSSTDQQSPPEMTVESFKSMLRKEWDDHLEGRRREEARRAETRQEDALDYCLGEDSLTRRQQSYASVQALIDTQTWRNFVERPYPRDGPPIQPLEEIKQDLTMLDKYQQPLDYDPDEEIFDQLARERDAEFRRDEEQGGDGRCGRARVLEGPYEDLYECRSEKNGHALLLCHPDLRSRPENNIFPHLLATDLTFTTYHKIITNSKQIETHLKEFFEECKSDEDGDCLMVVILSYGYVDDAGGENINCGDNTWMNSSHLWFLIDKHQPDMFTNKPKILIKLGWPCDGNKSKGLQSDDAWTKKPEMIKPLYNTKNLPSRSHLCIVSAIPQGCRSVAGTRDEGLATCFLNSLVEELRELKSEEDWELLSLLSRVNRKLTDKLKRGVSVLSSLTGAFVFKTKER